MKTKIHIKFDAEDIPGDAASILDPAGCGLEMANIHDYTIYDKRRVIVRLALDDGDNRIAKILELLEQHRQKPEVLSYLEYSEEDLQCARLLLMSSDVNEHISAGNMYGTKYDMEAACSHCGTGTRQSSALYIDGDDSHAMVRKHRAIGSYEDDILVDGGMVKKLQDAGVTGISFGEVRARLKNKKWSMVARDQIPISHTMPPMRSELTDDDKNYLCKVCRRGGFMTVPTRPFRTTPPYRTEDLVGMQDFNLTWEWFGNFWPKDKLRQARYPHPRVLVTPKVMNIFRDAGVKTFEWTPVFIEE